MVTGCLEPEWVKKARNETPATPFSKYSTLNVNIKKVEKEVIQSDWGTGGVFVLVTGTNREYLCRWISFHFGDKGLMEYMRLKDYEGYNVSFEVINNEQGGWSFNNWHPIT